MSRAIAWSAIGWPPEPGVVDEVARPERGAELAQRLDDEERRREPDRPAPVRVAALELRGRLGRLVRHAAPVPLERLRLVQLRQRADAVARQELALVVDVAEQPAQLRGVDDREQVGRLAVGPLDRVDHLVDQLAAVLEEPVEVRRELLERLDPLELEPLDREQRDQADQRADAELLRAAVGVAQHVVEEPVLAVEQRARRGRPCASSRARRRRSAGGTSIAIPS